MDTELKKQYEEEKDRIREEFSDYDFRIYTMNLKKYENQKNLKKIILWISI